VNMVPDEIIIDEVFSGIVKVPEHRDDYTMKMRTMKNNDAKREI